MKGKYLSGNNKYKPYKAMIFDCDRCGYTTTKKSDFIRHLSRKESCIATLNNVPLIEIKRKYQLIEPTKDNDPATHPYECLFCNRRYKYKYNKTKHLKVCRLRKETEAIHEEINSTQSESAIMSVLSEILNTLSVLDRKIEKLGEKQSYQITMFTQNQ